MSAVFGRKPASEIGYGLLSGFQSRASIMGQPASNGWVYRFGGLLGKQGAGTGSVWLGLYGTSGGTTITNRLARTASTIAVTNAVDWAGALVPKTAAPAAPLRIYAAYAYALQAGMDNGVVGAFGQDHSGHQLHDRDGSGSPDPFNQTRQSAQGKMALWVEYEPNVAPKTPTNLAPAPGSRVTTTPVLAGDFRDDNEELPGFAIGTADKVSAYRFEIWNQGKTSRLQDSGKTAAIGSQQTNRRVSWMPGTLSAGTYVARLTVWDMFDAPSPTAEWTFTVSSGGNITNVDLSSGWGSQTARIATAASPNLSAQWTSSDGLSMDRLQARTMRMPDPDDPPPTPTGDTLTDLINMLIYISGEEESVSSEITLSAAPGATIATSFAALGLAAMTPGGRYRIEMRGRDTTGTWSTWNGNQVFTVNAAPGAPADLQPSSGHVTSQMIELSAIVGDAIDGASMVTGTVEIRPQGGSPTRSMTSSYRDGRQVASLTATQMPSYATYEWRMRGTDPWGASGAWSSWRTLVYAPPPVVTISVPANNATLATGTPTITFAADTTLSSATITIREVGTGIVAHLDSFTVSGSGDSRTVPAATLRNETAYELTVDVTSTNGLVGTASRTFTISYPRPAWTGTLVAEVGPGPFEPAPDPSQWSRILVHWPEPSTAQAPVSEFAGYALYRTDVATGVTELLARPLGRQDRVFADTTACSGVVYDYSVSFVLEKNALDFVESQPLTAQASVRLANTVVTSLDGDDLNLVLRYWDLREAEHVREQESVPTWGRSPLVFMAATAYRVVSGEFVVVDDPNGTYRVRDVLDAVAAASEPVRQGDAVSPRIFVYRDPKGRVMTCTMAGHVEDDQHVSHRSRLRLTFTEADADVLGGG